MSGDKPDTSAPVAGAHPGNPTIATRLATITKKLTRRAQWAWVVMIPWMSSTLSALSLVGLYFFLFRTINLMPWTFFLYFLVLGAAARISRVFSFVNYDYVVVCQGCALRAYTEGTPSSTAAVHASQTTPDPKKTA